jgi:hypothetical protein
MLVCVRIHRDYKLDRIPKGDIKIVINAHGDSEGIISRSIEEIAEHISIIDRATGEGSVF